MEKKILQLKINNKDKKKKTDLSLHVAELLTKQALEKKINKVYFDRGRYNASITTNVTPLERNRVSIELIINEGEASTIKKINIIGNKAFDNKRLLGIMKSGTKYFFEFWSSKDTYSSSILNADIAKIENYYFDRGYNRFFNIRVAPFIIFSRC